MVKRPVSEAADEARELAGLDGVGAERGSDRALLDDRQLGRQRTGAKLHGERRCGIDGEAARDLARSAKDRLAHDGGREHLVVEHDSKGRADVVLGEVGELARARLVEAEGDDRLVGARVKARLRVDEILAGDDWRLLQHVGAAGLALTRRIDLVADRRPRLLGFLGRHRRVHGVERQLGGLTDEVLELLGVLQAGELHEDAVAALAHHGRLGRAHGVDAAVDCLDRRTRRARYAVLQSLLGRAQGDHVGRRLLDRDVVAAGAEDGVADRLDELLQGGVGLVHVLGLGDLHLHRVADDAEAAETDLGLAQLLAGVVAQRREPVLLQLVGVHGQQKVRAAAQVEAERQLAVGHPSRPAVHRLLREEVR